MNGTLPDRQTKAFKFFVPILTDEYVSRIEKKALEKLRVEFEKNK